MYLRQSSRTEDVLWATAALFVALFVMTLCALALDRRLLDGEPVWAKPLKFELSLALHFATIALVVGVLGPTWREGPLLEGVAWAAAVCAVLEVAYIALQAARQEPSHFNVGTPLRAAIYAAMAAGAVVITAAAAIAGLAALLDPAARLGPATRAGIAIGFIGGSLLTLLVAFRMGGSGSHHVGIEPPGGLRMPLTGWSLSVGDRRVPHFFATHMMQAVPLAGLGLDQFLARPAAIAGVVAVAAGWTALTLGLFWQAGHGLPLTRWSP